MIGQSGPTLSRLVDDSKYLRTVTAEACIMICENRRVRWRQNYGILSTTHRAFSSAMSVLQPV